MRRIQHPRRGVWQKASAYLGALASSLPAAGERLLDLSRHESAEMRRRAVFGLALWSKQHDQPVEALAALAQDPDPAVRRAAARSDSALSRLREYAAGDVPALRAGAAQAFGYLLRRRTREALEALALLVADHEPRVRAAAAAALALSPRRAADRALAVLAEFLHQCTFSTDPSGEQEALSAALGMLARHRPQKALGLVRQVAACHLEVCRLFAAWTLGGRALAGQRGVRTLAQALVRDPVPSVRHRMLQALRRAGRFAPARWQMALARQLLGDAHRLVRAHAAEAIGPLAAAFPEEGFPLLSDLARDEDAYLRMGAATAAGDAAGADPSLALEALRRLASDRDGGVRRAAAVALGSLAGSHPEQAAPLLWRLMEDSEAQVRAAAVRAAGALLASHGTEAAEALAARAADVHPQVRRAAVEALYAAATVMPEQCAQAATVLLGDEALRDLAAAVLAQAAAARPERTLIWLLEGLRAARTPRFLDTFAACHEDEDAAALARALNDLATGRLPGAVARAAKRLEGCDRLGTEALAALLRGLTRLLAARTFEELAALAPVILGDEKFADRLTSDSVRAFERLRLAARMISRAGAAKRGEDRLRNLVAARSVVDEAPAALAPDLDLVRLRLWREAFFVISTLLNAAIGAMQVTATVETRLASKQALRRDLVPLLVELHNVGVSPARDLRVEVETGPGYHPAGPSPVLAALYPGERRQVQLLVGVEPGVSQVRLVGHVTYGDQQHEDRRAAFEGQVVLLDPTKPFRPIENPYLPGKPLEPGSPMFFGHQAMFRFLKSALGGPTQGNVVVLTGQRRIGKTSILKQIGPALGDKFFPVFIDVQGLLVDTVPLFLHQLAWHAAKSLRDEGVTYDVPSPDDFERSPHLFRDQVAQAVEAAGDRRLVLMLDEFDNLDYKVASGLLPPAVFDYLRHIMQHVPDCAFVLSGSRRIEELAGGYWSFLFNLALHRHVPVLSNDEAQALVEKPMAQAGVVCEDLAAANICNLSGGHPYLTQLACHMLLEQCNEDQRLIIAAEHVDEVADELLQWGETHLRYWWDTASPEERAVLAAAAEETELAEAITGEAVAQRLGRAGIALDTAALESAITRLVEKDPLHSRGRDSGVFRLHTCLAGRWVRAHWPVGRVAHALRADEWRDEGRSAP